ncbi:MAG: beta-ketoacyl-[acyl-carrier-protein] synthase II [Lautropia sp. SCN 70-15]|nr:MAG: beta-ketoacyl-[acyl-carrier-protein] synthase II [Lautropia sp. SCN 70-15]
MRDVFLGAPGVVCALGQGLQALRDGLFAPQPSGLTTTDAFSAGRMLNLGLMPGELPAWFDPAPTRLRSRNNALLAAALAQIRPQIDAALARFGPARVAVVLGTSAAGLVEGEAAARWRLQRDDWPPGYDYAQQEMGSASAFVAHELGVCGPAHVISTACSSGAKALASGARLLRARLADAVVAGGVDALGGLTVAGFRALESVSAARCNPMSLNRCGINIGEGAALFMMTLDDGPVRLAGWGETSDAHHMSAPDPSGRGAIDAMRQALARAAVEPETLDYLNLHGTATPQNDAMESRAIAAVFSPGLPVSSTKPLTGHALAAAGAIEAAIAWLTLVDNPQGRLPPHWWDGEHDPALPTLRLVEPGEALGRSLRHVLSNSFAFGGSNAALLFSGA